LRHGVEVDVIDDRKLVLEMNNGADMRRYDVVVERCINHSRALYTLELLNSPGAFPR
jgi:hypothetical protein